MIAVVQNSSSSAEDMMTLRHRLYKHNITVKFFPNKVRLTFCKSIKFTRATSFSFKFQNMLTLSPGISHTHTYCDVSYLSGIKYV